MYLYQSPMISLETVSCISLQLFFSLPFCQVAGSGGTSHISGISLSSQHQINPRKLTAEVFSSINQRTFALLVEIQFIT